MIVELTNGTCLPFFGWDMYVLEGGAWKQVQLTGHGGFTGVPLKRVGNTIIETLPIRDPNKPICLADRGTESRTWAWNGSAFVPGPWRYKRKGAAALPVVEFYSPSGNIICSIDNRPAVQSAGCWTNKPPQSGTVTASGKVTLCRGAPRCAFNLGEGDKPKLLAYGRSITLGPFRCISQTTGMTCTMIATGTGFEIDRSHVRRVG